MVELVPNKELDDLPSGRELLYDGEIIVIVDDSPEILLLLETYLSRQHIPVAKANNAVELYRIIETNNVALLLLDIGLPGKSGMDILTEIVPQYPDLGIIMVTGTTDIQTALDCLRKGADDYLTKPVVPQEFNHTLYLTLKKRRLAIENRLFQKELESTNFRMQFLHSLNLKMNSAHLNAPELDTVLQTILAGITSEEGLRFNRAFLALFDDQEQYLTGRLAIGPSSREEAGSLWQSIKANRIRLHDILESIPGQPQQIDSAVNRIAMSLKVSASNANHILIKAANTRKSILVHKGMAGEDEVSPQLLNLLNETDFVVVPLFSPGRSLGVIIADNYVTQMDISEQDVVALEIFANQASLAIEHSHLHRDMRAKIEELECVNHELDKNKDMLLESERYSTIGYISAQLVHAIRNPITSIGASARLLLKKTEEEYTRKFLNIMVEESTKIEDMLRNLFQFAEDIILEVHTVDLLVSVRETLAVFYATFRNKQIEVELHLPEKELFLELDDQKMRKVLMHLLRNAIEAMEQGGKLVIAVYEDDKHAIVDISDTGSGIKESTLDAIKKPFFTTKTYGTGLGLALVDQILELHGATFTIRPIPTGGSRATIFFPLVKQED